MAKLKT